MNLKTRQLGRSGISVVPLALGGNVFGWTVDEQTSFKLLDRLVEAGFNFIDTADVYSRWIPGHQGGESETIIGKWLKRSGKRDRVVLATKLGMELGPNPGGGNVGLAGLAPAYIQRAVEASLRRLQTDYIDLYYAHRDDPNTPMADTLTAFGKLMAQGKVRAIGASNFSAERTAEAMRISNDNGLPRYECLQPHYNLYERADYERNLEPICVKEGLAVAPYYALASGFLTGKYRSEADLSKSPRGKGVAKYLDERGRGILAALDAVAARLNATPGQIAVAWLNARPSITAPIASATNLTQLEELLRAATLSLDPESIEQLNRASSYK